MSIVYSNDEKYRMFKQNLKILLNRHCAENGSNTPDFILADYLLGCLHSFDSAVSARSTWYGGKDHIPVSTELEP